MSPVICPFCQHENPSGTRFCAECGCSIHLKVCPNPQCGKISDVGADVCGFCGQAFPKKAKALVSDGPASTETSGGSREHGEGPIGTGKEKPRTAALPLIMIALVAGGLPILWANRAHLPAPKTWQNKTPDSTSAGDSTPASTVAVPTAQPSPVNSPSMLPPANAAAPGEPGPGSPASKIAADGSVRKIRNAPGANSTLKKVAKAPRVKAAEQPRPCTEATAALGLCDPKQVGK